MPVIQLKSNYKLEKMYSDSLMKELASCASSTLDKPLQNVMLMYSHEEMIMADSDLTAAYIDVTYVGTLSSEEKQKFCDSMLDILTDFIDVDPHRVYMNLKENPRENSWKCIEKTN